MHPIDARLAHVRDSLVGRVLRGASGIAYHLRELIGEGGQGWVFKAHRDDPDGFLVIVKVLRPDATTAETLVRFHREAEVLRRLAQQPSPNPYIVRYFDHAAAIVPTAGAGPVELTFTVLEYVPGASLEHVLTRSRGRGLALDRVRRILRHVVLALEHVHAQKIVHRDLKPSNILLSGEGQTETARVTDFGLVKLVDIGIQSTVALAGASLGYAPPEQYEQGNQRVGPHTDVFSLAAIAYEMLSGRPAFPYSSRENPLLIVTRMVNGPRPMLGRTRETLPVELRNEPELCDRFDELLARATASAPHERHPTVTELWGALEPLFRAALDSPSLAPTSPRARTGVLPKDPTQPGAWKWTVRTPGLAAGTVRAATFSPRGDAVIAVGPVGLARWDGRWTGLPSPVDYRAARGVVWAHDDLLIFGERAMVVRLSPSGALETWRLPDPSLTFHGVHQDDDGRFTFVGECPSRRTPRSTGTSAPLTAGVLAQFEGWKLTLLHEVATTTRLRAVTRLHGGLLVACGDRGALVRVELGVPEHVGSVCGGHLTAIRPLPGGGALTVGAGGHALAISPRLEAELEAVQTTRNLLSLTVGGDGTAWTGAAHARVLRRCNGSWIRMNGDAGTARGVVAIWAGGDIVRAVCDDATVLEGALS